MNINDLTIGQAKELTSIFGSSTTNKPAHVPVEIGKSYLFRTVTHIELGRVKDVNGKFVTLEKASWVADTGRYHECLRDGTLSEVEVYPDTTTVNADSLINFTPWFHDLPTESK